MLEGKFGGIIAVVLLISNWLVQATNKKFDRAIKIAFYRLSNHYVGLRQMPGQVLVDYVDTSST